MTTTTARCTCGKVTLEVTGAPIITAACYCDDCQAGSALVATLPGAVPMAGSDGGTEMSLYRKDRFRVTAGAEHLKPVKLKASTPTSRMIATCCNSAMYVAFDSGPFWTSVYRVRMIDPPPLEVRVNTKFAPDANAIPPGVPSHKVASFGFVAKLIGARLAMALGR